MKEDKGFSRREWFFVIFIIMLTQFLVQFIAFIYAGSSESLPNKVDAYLNQKVGKTCQ